MVSCAMPLVRVAYDVARPVHGLKQRASVQEREVALFRTEWEDSHLAATMSGCAPGS